MTFAHFYAEIKALPLYQVGSRGKISDGKAIYKFYFLKNCSCTLLFNTVVCIFIDFIYLFVKFIYHLSGREATLGNFHRVHSRLRM